MLRKKDGKGMYLYLWVVLDFSYRHFCTLQIFYNDHR